jgi:alanyl-tRNA synthetase
MTERLYYGDSYLREFRARVIERSDDGRVVYLDRSAFYPTSGGQPHDTGSIAGVTIVDVVDEGERIAHRTEQPLDKGDAGADAECLLNWPRRFDHMQQHSGQHLLSAVFIEQFGIETCSFHLGEEISTIDLETSAVEPTKVIAAERRANEAVFENRPILVLYRDAAEAAELRKPSHRGGTLRIVSIDGLDRIACGGTHVHSTAEIGPILIRKLEMIRGLVRVEFLCGSRAVRRARADFDALSRVAQTFSSALDDAPQVAAAQAEAARDNDRARRKLESELARYQGRELFDATAPDANGMRRIVRKAAAGSLDQFRGIAQSFTDGAKAVFIGALDQPPSVMLAVSADSGIDAGKKLQPLLKEAGGRGGGSARMAQGSVPSVEALEKILQAL